MTKQGALKKLGENIARIRKDKGLSQSELAKRCGKDRQNMYRLESGQQNATVELLLKVAKALSVPIKDLLDFD